jgi:hypothetical protein
LDAASLTGDLIINDVVYAELSVRFARIEELDEVLDHAGVALAPNRAAGGIRNGVLPDFFIGAHAAISGEPLLRATSNAIGRISRPFVFRTVRIRRDLGAQCRIRGNRSWREHPALLVDEAVVEGHPGQFDRSACQQPRRDAGNDEPARGQCDPRLGRRGPRGTEYAWLTGIRSARPEVAGAAGAAILRGAIVLLRRPRAGRRRE